MVFSFVRVFSAARYCLDSDAHVEALGLNYEFNRF